MKRIFEILTMVALLIWGAVFLYFYFSGRVNDLLAERFRIGVPISGTGMIILGALNLINRNRDAGACAHDHAHGDHSHCDHDHHDQAGHEHCDHDHHHDHHHDEKCDHEHDHEHSHAGHSHDESTASSLAFALLILIVPLLVSARFTPRSFSGDYVKKWDRIEQDMQQMRQRKAAESRKMAAKENPYADPGTGDAKGGEDSSSSGGGEAWGEFTLEDLKKMVPQTSAGDFLLDVPQIFYTAGDQELMKVMEGISVETTAQVIEDTAENSPENRLRAYRLLIECCAADARPLSIPIDFTETAPEYKEMGWYKLIGRLHFHKSEEHEYTPILQIKKFEATPEPADWMSIY